MKKLHKIVVAVSIILILLITVIAALPMLISSSGGRQFAVRQINKHIPGELTIASWSLCWLGNMKVEKLAFNDINGKRLFDLSKLSISRGVLGLVADHNELGNVKLVKPVVSVSAPVDISGKNSSESVSDKSLGSNGNNKNFAALSRSSSAKSGFSMPKIRGIISIEDGVVQMLSSNGISQTVVKDLALEMTLAGSDNPLAFKVNGISATPGSMLAGSGNITLPQGGEVDVNKIAVDMQLKIKNVSISPFTAIAAQFAEVPQINGVLNADINIQGSLGDGIGVKTDLSASSLAIPEMKAKFGDIQLAIDGDVTKSSANIKSAIIKSKFCNITASGKYGGSGSSAITAKAEMDIATTVDFLKGMGVITNDMSCAGYLRAAIDGTSSGSIISITKADVNISGVDLSLEGKRLKQESIVLSAPANINISERQVNVPEAELTASLGSIFLTSFNIGDWTNILGSVKTNVKADLDIKATREAISDFITLPDNWGFSGRLKADLNIDSSKQEHYNIKLNASTTGLRIESTEPPLVIEDNPVLAAEVVTTPQFDVIEVKSAKLSSELLDMNMTADFKKNGKKSSLAVEGALAPSLTELSRYMDAYSDIPVTFSGKKSEPFDFNINWSGTGDSLKITSMNGNGGLYAGKIDGFGFHIREFTVPVVVKDNKAELEIKAKINNGDLDFVSSIDLSGDHPAIHIPNDLYILKDVNITTEVADELLGLINPVFRGVSTVSGKMSMVMNNFLWPLKKEDMMARIFTGKVLFNDVDLAANGLLTDLLDLAKVGTRELKIGDTSIDINCADGKITSSPLNLRVKKYELILDGVIGLDNSLAYHAKVPMTETLVGKSGYKYLEGMSLDVPIKGTVQKPVLNLSSFESALSKLVQQAATKALSGELEKQLNKLFK